VLGSMARAGGMHKHRQNESGWLVEALIAIVFEQHLEVRGHAHGEAFRA
jgi:hypothetical protein